MKALTALLVAVNVGFLAWAVSLGSTDLPLEWAVVVTNGWLVAGGIVLTFLVAWPLARFLPRGVGAPAAQLLLAGQAFHASGQLLRLYYVYPWYDDALHFASVIGIALIAMATLRAADPAMERRLRVGGVALLGFAIAVAIVGLWEIFEFSTDALLGTREQDDLVDTMMDMVDGTMGAAVAGAWTTLRALLPSRSGADAPRTA